MSDPTAMDTVISEYNNALDALIEAARNRAHHYGLHTSKSAFDESKRAYQLALFRYNKAESRIVWD
jgi:hypothetical protein